MKKKYFLHFEFSWNFQKTFLKKEYFGNFLRISAKEKEFQCIFAGEV